MKVLVGGVGVPLRRRLGPMICCLCGVRPKKPFFQKAIFSAGSWWKSNRSVVGCRYVVLISTGLKVIGEAIIWKFQIFEM